MARENKMYYTPKRLVDDCQRAIEKYGRNVGFTFFYQGNEGIGELPERDSAPLWQAPVIKSIHRVLWDDPGSAVGQIEGWIHCHSKDSELAREVIRLLGLLGRDSGDPSGMHYFAFLGLSTSELPLGVPRKAFFWEGDYLNEDNSPEYVETRKHIIEGIRHHENNTEWNYLREHPNCQWTMVWDDVLGAIQMAFIAECSTNKITDMSEPTPDTNNEIETKDDDASFTLTEKERRVFVVLYEADTGDLLSVKEIMARTEIDNDEVDTVGKDVVSRLVSKLMDNNPPFAERPYSRKGCQLTIAGRHYWQKRERKE